MTAASMRAATKSPSSAGAARGRSTSKKHAACSCGTASCGLSPTIRRAGDGSLKLQFVAGVLLNCFAVRQIRRDDVLDSKAE